MNNRPFILITNDDGINAPGIKHLWESISEFADVAVVAPSNEKSGAGLSITWTKPLKLQTVNLGENIKAWSLNGTPADCIKMACSVLFEKQPDMILSGINKGSNAGRTVLYSGTVGGVIEGALRNIPGIAFSFCDFATPPLSSIKQFIHPMVFHFLKNPLPQGTFLNVNFPHDCQNFIKGVRLAKQGTGYWMEAPEKRMHPEGVPYYWLGGKWSEFPEDPESDVALLKQGYITAVPIHINQLTDHLAFQNHKEKLEKLFDLEISTKLN